MTKSKRNPNQQISDALDASETEITVADETEQPNCEQETQQNLIDVLYAGEAESKAQLAVSVKAYGWQVFHQVGAEYDARMIMETAKGQIQSPVSAPNKEQMDELAKRMKLKTPQQLLQEVEAKKEGFFKDCKKLSAQTQKALPKG